MFLPNILVGRGCQKLSKIWNKLIAKFKISVNRVKSEAVILKSFLWPFNWKLLICASWQSCCNNAKIIFVIQILIPLSSRWLTLYLYDKRWQNLVKVWISIMFLVKKNLWVQCLGVNSYIWTFLQDSIVYF